MKLGDLILAASLCGCLPGFAAGGNDPCPVRIAELLMRHACVKAFLAGHHHPGGCHAFGRIRHFTFQGLIEGSDNRYAVVEVYRDKLVIRGYGAQPGATLEFR